MARPVQTQPRFEEPPAFDRDAIERSYRLHRARRHARLERRRAAQLAGVRFWAIAGGLLLGFLVLAVTIWLEIGQLFGL